MIRPKLSALLAVLVLVTSTDAAAADPATAWESGSAAFAAGQYDEALRHFEVARDGGLGGPAVHYNIAVSQFSMGNYGAARETFQLIARQFPSMRGLAQYNVGLTERRLGNPDAAQRQFIAAYRNSIDEKVRVLAMSQLTELERDTRSDWYGLLGVEVGHDDNVALRDSLGLPAGVSAESPTANLFAMLSGPLSGGVELDGSLYAVTYSDADEFDQMELRVGAMYTIDRGDWRHRAGIYGVAGTAGGSSFNREANLDLRSTRYLGDNAAFELRLRYDEITSAQLLFDGIEGSRSRLDMRYRWNGIGHSLAVRLGLEKNDRRDANASPFRQRVQADYGYQLNNRWGLESALSFRTSEYDDLAVRRTEDLFSAVVRLVYETGSVWQFSGSYQYSKNDSSDPVYSYDRNLLMLGFQRLF
ncbi:MAG: tetratricopeptide repeat protein [Gammaproteobacteria bacterium]|nr:tetratricopeptide repeat protein [Gammaproteobacteria bacterium]